MHWSLRPYHDVYSKEWRMTGNLSAHCAGGEGFRRICARRMRRGDAIAARFAVERKPQHIAAQIEIVDELAAENNGRHIRHQIHGRVCELPQLAAFVP